MRRRFAVCTDAADEARRRVLRDLHDGLGPSLAAIALGLRAARHLVARDPAAAGSLLARLEDEMRNAVGEIRRLAAGAYPAELAGLGLAGAVRAHVATLADRHPVRVFVQVDEALPELPIAVQVAAYRIICEALTNVVRHAGARTCVVRLWCADGLHVEVVDDGCGAGESGGSGVGLNSMRERAREVGGTWAMEDAAAGGTRIAVDLPVAGGV
ncbi:signal transduction histidine kinase [Saccharothrix tamanrassetensis]|uniref:Oxygen sensor histidine kinase NreB n=1 Tax=Saccharothrix tamanrassetensis TaxID=1051531 RepID=A0A841CLB2_9PSEU|nr:sensor histidine kinase [Saccharothrix tamanrassetensis]MBB5959282.1 signal transduction histidine kinase [Saccharothrix tamanrassetensis]